MKLKTTLFSMALAALLLSGNPAGAAEEAKTCNLTVDVWGFRNNNGHIIVGLWNKEDKWLNNEGNVAGDKATIKNRKASIEFKDLKCGSYAVAVFHDANDNEKQDKNWFGIPTEGYGFSGDGDYRYGSAKFKQAVFEVKTGDNQVRVKLNNVM